MVPSRRHTFTTTGLQVARDTALGTVLPRTIYRRDRVDAPIAKTVPNSPTDRWRSEWGTDAGLEVTAFDGSGTGDWQRPDG